MATGRANPDAFVRSFDFHDGSHYQHDAARQAGITPTVDFAALRATSDVLEWKCTQSTGYTDPTWGWVRDAMEEYRFRLRIGYHWLSSTTNPITQADHFLTKFGPWTRGRGFVLDGEEKGITVAASHRFMVEVEAEAKRPGIGYTGLYVSGGTIWKSPELRYECEYGPRPMHLAAYVSKAMLLWHMERTGNLDLPVHAWQYSSDGPVAGITGRADMNKMLDLAAYERACGIVAQPPPPVTKPPVPVPVPAPLPKESKMQAIVLNEDIHHGNAAESLRFGYSYSDHDARMRLHFVSDGDIEMAEKLELPFIKLKSAKIDSIGTPTPFPTPTPAPAPAPSVRVHGTFEGFTGSE